MIVIIECYLSADFADDAELKMVSVICDNLRPSADESRFYQKWQRK